MAQRSKGCSDFAWVYAILQPSIPAVVVRCGNIGLPVLMTTEHSRPLHTGCSQISGVYARIIRREEVPRSTGATETFNYRTKRITTESISGPCRRSVLNTMPVLRNLDFNLRYVSGAATVLASAERSLELIVRQNLRIQARNLFHPCHTTIF